MKYILATVLFAVFTSVAVLSASAWWGSGGPEGWWFERSLPVGAKAHGHQSVSAPEHPVRYGKHSERFEVKPGIAQSPRVEAGTTARMTGRGRK